MEQLILRQAAIDALRTCYDTETITMDNGDEYINYGDAVGEIKQLPSIQSDVVRCKDCKHWKDSDGVFRRGTGAESECPLNLRQVYEGTFFCGRAERREVTT